MSYIVDITLIHELILYEAQAKDARACFGYFSLWFLLDILQLRQRKRAGLLFVHFMKLFRCNLTTGFRT